MRSQIKLSLNRSALDVTTSPSLSMSTRLRPARKSNIESAGSLAHRTPVLGRSLSESASRSFADAHKRAHQHRLCSSDSGSASSRQPASQASPLDASVPVPVLSIPPTPQQEQDFQPPPEALDPNMVKLKPDIGAAGFPELPPIRSEDVRLQVFTHRSFFARPTHVFEDLPTDPAPDNEMLEHLGDAVLGLVITGLVRDSYRHLRVGPATKIRALVVGNATLADISVTYGLPRFLRLHRAQAITLKASVHIQADVFEAYVGGVYVDQGIDVVRPWLNALFRPYVREAYSVVRGQHGLPPTPPEVPPTPSTTPIPTPDVAGGMLPGTDWVTASPVSTSTPGTGGPGGVGLCGAMGAADGGVGSGAPASITVGHLALFNQHMQQQRKSVEWRYKAEKGEGTKTTPIWTVRALLDGHTLAVGRGNTKKAAQNEASKEALVKLGVNVGPD